MSSPTAEACADVSTYMRTKLLREFDERQDLKRSNPLLYLAYWIEAAADRRIECDVNALSLLTDMRERAREAVARQTGAPFRNALYPERRR